MEIGDIVWHNNNNGMIYHGVVSVIKDKIVTIKTYCAEQDIPICELFRTKLEILRKEKINLDNWRRSYNQYLIETPFYDY